MNKKNKLTHLLQLCQFSDSALPIGSFAFSNGLESAIQLKVVTDEKSLNDYIMVCLKKNASLDGVYINDAHQAAKKGNIQRLIEIENSYRTKIIGKEQQLMTNRVGQKLATLFLNINDSELLDEYLHLHKDNKDNLSHAIIHSIICSELSLSQEETFALYHYGIASMILSAAVRLMRIDHYQTQRILFEVNKNVDDFYAASRRLTLDDTHSFSPMFDCLVAHHVDAHLRMFMN
ncbi:urease accessory protein UreF [Photobacterium damselae]|uniref:urease accessory protein UreF n=1 Tax=Photobacterium damselae TaxID=38293 RepID=UPI001F2DDF12|nr:urease accessory UreF family protein [Photobacterium damselae]UKA12002.1 hypothetical protein IHC91_19755 [Photobacterium damselae subsp. damselae]